MNKIKKKTKTNKIFNQFIIESIFDLTISNNSYDYGLKTLEKLYPIKSAGNGKNSCSCYSFYQNEAFSNSLAIPKGVIRFEPIKQYYDDKNIFQFINPFYFKKTPKKIKYCKEIKSNYAKKLNLDYIIKNGKCFTWEQTLDTIRWANYNKNSVYHIHSDQKPFKNDTTIPLTDTNDNDWILRKNYFKKYNYSVLRYNSWLKTIFIDKFWEKLYYKHSIFPEESIQVYWNPLKPKYITQPLAIYMAKNMTSDEFCFYFNNAILHYLEILMNKINKHSQNKKKYEQFIGKILNRFKTFNIKNKDMFQFQPQNFDFNNIKLNKNRDLNRIRIKGYQNTINPTNEQKLIIKYVINTFYNGKRTDFDNKELIKVSGRNSTFDLKTIFSVGKDCEKLFNALFEYNNSIKRWKIIPNTTNIFKLDY